MFIIENILNFSYGGLREGISDLHSLRAIEDKAYGCFTRFPVSGHRLGLLTSWYLFQSVVDKPAIS